MTEQAADQIAHLEMIITTLRRRKRVLDTQVAIYGKAATPAHLVLELEDLMRQLAHHEVELRRLRPGPFSMDAPYLGLLTFQEADTDRFFGRESLVTSLLDKIRNTAFL